MEFTFLGTSAGIPTRSRNVTGLALARDFDTYRPEKDLSLSCLTTGTST